MEVSDTPRTQERAPDSISSPLRLCLLNEYFWPDTTGGTGTVLSELVTALGIHPDARVEIDVITSRNLYRRSSGQDMASLPERDEWNGARIRRVEMPRTVGNHTVARIVANSHFCIAALWALLTEHRQRRYDLVIVGTAPPMLVEAAAIFRRVTGTPYLYIIYDLEPDRAVVLHVLRAQSVGARIIRTFQRRWLHGAARVVVLGRCMNEHIALTYGLPPGQIADVPIGGNPDGIRPIAREASTFRREQKLTGSFVVLYSGNFGRYHNFDTILDAAKEVATSVPHARFVLVGSGAQRAAVERRVTEECIANVRLLPFVESSEYPDLLAAADVSLVTLEPGMEGLCVPSKFYSILASGRPVLALMGANCEAARVIAEENCGVRVDARDAGTLASTISNLAAQPELCAEMGKRSRAALKTRFSSQIVADKYLSAIRAAASKKQSAQDKWCPNMG